MSEEQTQLGWKGHIVGWKTNILGRIPNVVSSVTAYNISMDRYLSPPEITGT